MPGSHLVHVCEISVFKPCLEPAWGTLGSGQMVFRCTAELLHHIRLCPACWGHVRCLRRGPSVGLGVMSLVPVKVFCRGLSFASMSECVGLCRPCQGILGHVVSFWAVSKHCECVYGLCLCSVLCCGLIWSLLPSQLPVLLVPFCCVGVGKGMQIPGWKPRPPIKSPSPLHLPDP